MCYVGDQVSQMRKANPLAATQKGGRGNNISYNVNNLQLKIFQGKIIKIKYMKRMWTSSSSTRVLKMTSISQVNISQAIKGNLQGVERSFKWKGQVLNKMTAKLKFNVILEWALFFTVLWNFFHNVTKQLLHLGLVT